jgi:O-6-methylguanine DNA methyltransferase
MPMVDSVNSVSAPTLRLHGATIATPVGELLALATDRGLCALEFRRADDAGPDRPPLHARLQRRLQRWFPAYEIANEETPILARTRDWLSAYFAGVSAEPPATAGLALDLRGAPFEQRVWSALVEIPAGATCSYGAIAVKLGAPGASRAVGAANGANPVSIIVPCHRVIGSSGQLTGYGGGLDRKKWLLDHEARWRAQASLF